MQIDITVFLVEALASNNNIKKDIEEIYQKNKYKAYKLAKDSEYYSHPIITSGSLEWEMRCKKALGIVLLDLIEEQDNTLTLIQKGWRSLYKHLESKKNETLNVEKILTTYVSPKQTDNEIFAVVTMIVVLQNMFKYEIEDKENLKVFQDRVLFTMNKHSEIKKVDFDTYSEKYICIETRKKLFRFNSINFSEYSHMMNQFNKKAINSLEFIEDLEELYIDNLLEDIKLTKKDIDELIMTYRLSEEYDLNSQRDLEKLLNYLLYAMQIRFLLKAYKKVKKQFFENNSETMYVELEHLENQVKDLQQKLEQQQKQIAYLNYENTKLKKEYKEGLEKQISKLERENIKLCTQLEEGLKNKVELEKLRNFLFPEKVEVKDEHEIDITTYKILIIGGHPSWQERLSQEFSDFIFLDGTIETFDVNILESADIIFFKTSYMNHGVYYKAIEFIRKKNLKFGYIKNDNIDLVLKEIKNALI